MNGWGLGRNIIRKRVLLAGTDCEDMWSSRECSPKGNLKQEELDGHTDKMTNSVEVSASIRLSPDTAVLDQQVHEQGGYGFRNRVYASA